MAHVFLLAVAAALYPALLAGVILILTRPSPRAQLAAFLAGGLAVSLTAGCVLLFVVEGTRTVQSSQRTVAPAVDIAAALLSLAVAARLWKRRATPRAAPKDHASWLNRTLARGSIPLAVVVGVVLNLPGIWYLAAINEIGQGGYGTTTEVLLLLAFNLVMFTLAEVPLVWYVVSPGGAQRAVGRFDGLVHAHARELGAAVAAAIGAYLLVKGLAEAVSPS